MPRPLPPAQIVDMAMQRLERLIRNLLVDNKNFKSSHPDKLPHYFEETPRTPDFVRKTLSGMADSILERLQEVRVVSVDMAADADIPGLTRVHSGHIGGYDVTVSPVGNPDGDWHVSLAIPDAFHDGDDREATFPHEGAALEAVRKFALDNEIPEVFVARAPRGPSPT